MDNINADPQSIGVAVAIGGALLAGAMTLFSYFRSSKPADNDSNLMENTQEKQSTSSQKKQKKKAAAKKKKKASSSTQVAAKGADKPSSPKASKSVSISDPAAQNVQSVEGTPKKKKKKRRGKKKKANKEETESSDNELEGPGRKSAASPTNEYGREPRAADFYNEEAVQDDMLDGWETVPVRSRRQKNENDVAKIDQLASEVSGSTVSGSRSKKKKEKRETVNIGEFVSVVLGEGGTTISNIQVTFSFLIVVYCRNDQMICLDSL